ncbi:MAG: hypothetical protein J6B72_03205 [Clostridia bacterium]|nr:hypothetical protein [Clostridia bacterium]
MRARQSIAKDFYRYPQINGFISVKQYMFVHEDGKKYLLIRFSNDSDFCAGRLKYRVTRMDIEGEVLGSEVYDSGSIVLEQGNTYSPARPIEVEDRCADFKIEMVEVRSGNYRYHVREGRVVTTYVRDGGVKDSRDTRSRGVEVSTVKRRGVGAIAIAAAVLLLLAVMVNALQMLFSYVRAQRKEKELENKVNISYDRNAETYKYFTYDSEKVIYEVDTISPATRK